MIAEHFEDAIQILNGVRGDEKLGRMALLLVAQCLVSLKRGVEAELVLDQLMQDTALTSEEKIETAYWLARTSEVLGDRLKAIFWFEQVLGVDPQYRDVVSRMQAWVRSD